MLSGGEGLRLDRQDNKPGEIGWIDQEISGSQFKDSRLGKRFVNLTKQLWCGLGEPIPYACQDWSNVKAAYRFLSNERFNEENILQGHFQATEQRFGSAKDQNVLILHDTTEFSALLQEYFLACKILKMYFQ